MSDDDFRRKMANEGWIYDKSGLIGTDVYPPIDSYRGYIPHEAPDFLAYERDNITIYTPWGNVILFPRVIDETPKCTNIYYNPADNCMYFVFFSLTLGFFEFKHPDHELALG